MDTNDRKIKEKSDSRQMSIGLKNAFGLKISNYSRCKISTLNYAFDKIENGKIIRRNG